MLSVMYGVSALIPITFAVSGYLLVSRDEATPDPRVTPQPSTTSEIIESERTDNHD